MYNNRYTRKKVTCYGTLVPMNRKKNTCLIRAFTETKVTNKKMREREKYVIIYIYIYYVGIKNKEGLRIEREREREKWNSVSFCGGYICRYNQF